MCSARCARRSPSAHWSRQPRWRRAWWRRAVATPTAQRRLEAALTAGGRLVSASRAPAVWVLADIEGNEACVTTWQGRDVPPS
ncbi:VOC family protein [Micromonospora sp. NPDC003944]